MSSINQNLPLDKCKVILYYSAYQTGENDMPKSYKASNGRIIQRRGNGRFRATTLQDFGISKSDLTDGPMICLTCGYGSAEYWRPVMKSGYCPKCGSTEKKPAGQLEAGLQPKKTEAGLWICSCGKKNSIFFDYCENCEEKRVS